MESDTIAEHIVCHKCGLTKEAEAFYMNGARRRKVCKDCICMAKRVANGTLNKREWLEQNRQRLLEMLKTHSKEDVISETPVSRTTFYEWLREMKMQA